MKNLTQYVEERNFMNSMFGDKTEIDPNNITSKQADDLWYSLDGDMSPENLSCDGERPPAQVRYVRQFLGRVAKELEKSHARPADLYCI